MLSEKTLKNGDDIEFQLKDAQGKAIASQKVNISFEANGKLENYSVITDKDGKFYLVLKNEELDFRYRYSAFQDRINGFIISAKMHFDKSNFLEIEEKINDARGKRISSQPLEFPSAGSTFKRMDGFLTSKAIDEAGLKGYKIGGAQVSEKHAGFIINRGNATSQDIIDLIEYVKKVIYEKYNKEIEAEVRIIGR